LETACDTSAKEIDVFALTSLKPDARIAVLYRDRDACARTVNSLASALCPRDMQIICGSAGARRALVPHMRLLGKETAAKSSDMDVAHITAPLLATSSAPRVENVTFAQASVLDSDDSYTYAATADTLRVVHDCHYDEARFGRAFRSGPSITCLSSMHS
jgi:hypothetical protein